jgi:hypothetical protein
VEPHLAALFGHQRTVEGKGSADLGGQCVADAFLVSTDSDGAPGRVAET